MWIIKRQFTIHIWKGEKKKWWSTRLKTFRTILPSLWETNPPPPWCGCWGKTDSSRLRVVKIVKTWMAYLAVLRKLGNGRKVCFIGGSCFRPLWGLANYKILLVAMQGVHLWRAERPTSRSGEGKGGQTSGEFANKLDVAKGEEWGSLGKNIRKSSDARSWCV